MATGEIDFHLEIGPYPHADHPDRYLARVIRAPSGGRPSAVFDLDIHDIVNRRDDLENAILAASVSARRAIPVSEQSLHEVGTGLFRAVFDGAVNNAYRASLGAAQHQRKRLRLVLSLTAPELAAVPWEMLFDPDDGRYLCRQRPLVRHIPAPDFDPLPLEVTPPLRVLCFVASPRNLGALNTEAEIAQLRAALREEIDQHRIELVCVPQASWSTVHRYLLSGTWHVVHFIGHGDYDPVKAEGCIALVGEDGRADMVEASRLTELLDEAEPTPRLVVLNSCSSGRAASDDLFAGTAAALARGGVSAVAAMQFTVSDAAAIEFARGFYTAVAEGRDIDRAVLSGRKSILGLPNTLEWVTPVLYIRGGSTRLFRLTDQSPRTPSNPLPTTVPNPPSNPAPVQAPPEQRSFPPISFPVSEPRLSPASQPQPDLTSRPVSGQPSFPVPEQWPDRRSRQESGPVGQPSRRPVDPPGPTPRPERRVAPRPDASDQAPANTKPVAPSLMLCLVAAGLAILGAALMFVHPFVPFANDGSGKTLLTTDEFRIRMVPILSFALIAGLAGVLASSGRTRQIGFGLMLSGVVIGPWLLFTLWISEGGSLSAWSSDWGIAIWILIIGASSWIVAAGVAILALLSTRVNSPRPRLPLSDRHFQVALLMGGSACIVILVHHYSMPDTWPALGRISQPLGGLWIAAAALLVPLVASAIHEHSLQVGLVIGWAGVSTAFLFDRFRELYELHDDSAAPMILAIIFGLLVVACVVLFTRTWRNGGRLVQA